MWSRAVARLVTRSNARGVAAVGSTSRSPRSRAAASSLAQSARALISSSVSPNRPESASVMRLRGSFGFRLARCDRFPHRSELEGSYAFSVLVGPDRGPPRVVDRDLRDVGPGRKGVVAADGDLVLAVRDCRDDGRRPRAMLGPQSRDPISNVAVLRELQDHLGEVAGDSGRRRTVGEPRHARRRPRRGWCEHRRAAGFEPARRGISDEVTERSEVERPASSRPAVERCRRFVGTSRWVREARAAAQCQAGRG